MQKKKKVLTWLLPTILGALALVCVGAFFLFHQSLGVLQPRETAELTIWHYYAGTQKDAFDELLDRFNAEVGAQERIHITGLGQGNAAQLGETLLAAAQGAAAMPNIFSAYPDTALDVAAHAPLANLAPYLTAEQLNKYEPSYIQEGKIFQDDQLVILPVAKSFELLAINQTGWDAFVAANPAVSVAQLDTWQGLLAVAQTYYDWTDAQTPDVPSDGRAFLSLDTLANFMIVAHKQEGVDLLSDMAQGKLHWNNDSTCAVWDLFFEGYVKGLIDKKGRFATDDVAAGDALACLCSTSGGQYFPTMLALADGTSQPVEPLLLPYPTQDGQAAYVIQQGAGMAVVKQDAALEKAAVRFLTWLAEPEQSIRFATASSYLPVMRTADIRATLTTYLKQQPMDTPQQQNVVRFMEAALDQLATRQPYASPVFPGSSAVRPMLEKQTWAVAAEGRTAYQAALAAGQTPAEAYAALDEAAYFLSWKQGIQQEYDNIMKANTP